MMGDPFVGNVQKKLSQEELIQALRVDIAGELEAIMAYDAHALATDDERVKTILYSIRDEERQHVGELIHLLEILDPQEAQFLIKGKQEVDQLLNQKGYQIQQQQGPQAQQAQQAQPGQQAQQAQQAQPAQQGYQSHNQWTQGQQHLGFNYHSNSGNLGHHGTQNPGNLGHHGPHNW